MSRYDTFNRILTSLHEATFDDTQWLYASTLISEACGAVGNALVVADTSEELPRILFAGFYGSTERRDDLERLYFDDYYPWDERVPRASQLPDGQLVHVRELYSAEELRTSRTYNEALPRMDGQKSLNVRLDGPGGTSILWCLADPVEPIGWGSAQIEMVQSLMPHIRHFVSVRQAVAGADALGASLAKLLDNTRVGVMHLDRSGRIVEANGSARRLLKRADGIFEVGGSLRARSPADNKRLGQVLACGLPESPGSAANGSTTVRRAPGIPSLMVHVHPVTAEREMDLGLRNVSAVVLVVDPGSPPDVDAELVAKALGLTPSQSQVAALLAQGKTVRGIASLTGRRENAVHFLLKQGYRKLGISRQTELVRLVLSSVELTGPRTEQVTK